MKYIISSKVLRFNSWFSIIYFHFILFIFIIFYLFYMFFTSLFYITCTFCQFLMLSTIVLSVHCQFHWPFIILYLSVIVQLLCGHCVFYLFHTPFVRGCRPLTTNVVTRLFYFAKYLYAKHPFNAKRQGLTPPWHTYTHITDAPLPPC